MQAVRIADGLPEGSPRRLDVIAALSRWTYHNAKFAAPSADPPLDRYLDSVLAYREKILALGRNRKLTLMKLSDACRTAAHHDRAVAAAACLTALLPVTAEEYGARSKEIALAHLRVAQAQQKAGRKADAIASLGMAKAMASGEALAEILEQSAEWQRDSKKREADFDEATAIRERTWGEDDPRFSRSLGVPETWSRRDEEYAGRFLRRRVEVERKYRPGGQVLGEALLDLAEHADAQKAGDPVIEPYFEEAVAILRRGTDRLRLAWALQTLGEYRAHRQEYKQAADAVREAVDIRREEPHDDRVQILWPLGNEAEWRLRAGDVEGCEAAFREFAEIGRMRNAGSLTRTAEMIGGLYEERGDWARAAEKYEVAVAAQESAKDDPIRRADTLAKLARAYQMLGRTREANAFSWQLTKLYFQAIWGDGKSFLIFGAVLAGMAIPGLIFGAGGFFYTRSLDGRLALLHAPPARTAVEAEAPEGEAIAALTPAAPEVQRAEFQGDGGTLFAIRIVNLLLSVLTLGAYFFWGKARVRRYVYAQTEFLGDRFAFLGTGREMLRGWLKSLPAIAFIVFGPNFIPIFWPDPKSILWAQGAVTVVFLLLWPAARVGAYRYRMNRTAWRGIRFSFQGRTRDYFWLSMKSYLLIWLTSGIYYPVYGVRVRKLLMDRTYFGDRPFRFDGRGRDLLPAFVLTLPAVIATLGLGWAWFAAARARYEWAHTTFGESRFRCTATGWSLLRLWAGNVAIFVLTLGLGMPWAITRTVDYWTLRVELLGTPELDTIRQSEHAASAVGESFADFLGFDFGI
ncbi:MAG: DUF898 family protein [Bryobacteraceae bacterium]